MRPDTADYRQIFLSGAPLMDTRAPVEFNRGAFPGAVNLPLMDDHERHLVGTCYKQQGQQAAIALGHQLVSGTIKAERLAAWADFARQHPNGYLYCFRGGLRSHTVQQWLKSEAGVDYPLVQGGYKAMRTFLLQTTLDAVQQCGWLVLGGLTGTGKTDVLAQLSHGIDLEGHAHHRGSSFGKHATPQPTQIDFENQLAVDLLRRRASGNSLFVLEDESRLIGACALPLELHQAMQQAPLVWLEDTLEQRVERILRDYVVRLCDEFVTLHGPELGVERFATQLLQSLGNIRKRLGQERHARLHTLMQSALQAQAQQQELELHRAWISALLQEYYDPMYAFQRDQKHERIVFSGDQAAVTAYLQDEANRQVGMDTGCSAPASRA